MKMDWLRTALIGGMLVVCFLLFIRWNEFQERQVVTTGPETTLASGSADIQELDNAGSEPISEVPTAPESDSVEEPAAAPEAPRAQLVRVQTDSLDVLIDTHGGDIVKAALLEHRAKLDTPEQPFVLLNRTQAHTYVAQSGLVGPNGTDRGNDRPVFASSQASYSLRDNEDQLSVDLSYRQGQVEIIKRFTFERESHLINISYIINNQASTPWAANLFGQIKRDSYNPNGSAGLGMKPYLGAATTTAETNYKKIDFDDLRDSSFKHSIEGGWIAMVQHYFISAWVPPRDSVNHYNLRKAPGRDLYYLGFTSDRLTVAPGETASLSADFYAGPKKIRVLEDVAPYLDLTVDFSWLWWIAKPLFFALDFIHDLVGNWGVAIILLTVVIKAIFFMPSAASYRSMAKMRKVQPKMAALKERYGDDKQKMSAELMKLYRDEKVNPLTGCLPVLIQMPVFIALYWVLMESVELRHAPFMLWIQDLSSKDPYFVLPLVMGATMWIQQKLNPTPSDPMQAKVMQMMPIFFTFLFMVFPAGLVLYWVVNNTLSITQQYFITKKIENSPG